MNLKIDGRSPIPIRRQLAEQLKHAIESGGVPPDQALPSIRELASASTRIRSRASSRRRAGNGAGQVSGQHAGQHSSEHPRHEHGETHDSSSFVRLPLTNVMKRGGYGLKKDIIFGLVGAIGLSWAFRALAVFPGAGIVAMLFVAFVGAAGLIASRVTQGRTPFGRRRGLQMGPMLVFAGLMAGWVAEAFSGTRGYGFMSDLALGLVGSVAGGGALWRVVPLDAGGMLAMFLVGCGGAVLAIVVQWSFWPSFRLGT